GERPRGPGDALLVQQPGKRTISSMGAHPNGAFANVEAVRDFGHGHAAQLMKLDDLPLGDRELRNSRRYGVDDGALALVGRAHLLDVGPRVRQLLQGDLAVRRSRSLSFTPIA